MPFPCPALTDPAGSVTGLNLSLTAGAVAAFDHSGDNAPLLIFPGRISPGPASVSTMTMVRRLSAVPGPGAGLLVATGLALALRRRAR